MGLKLSEIFVVTSRVAALRTGGFAPIEAVLSQIGVVHFASSFFSFFFISIVVGFGSFFFLLFYLFFVRLVSASFCRNLPPAQWLPCRTQRATPLAKCSGGGGGFNANNVADLFLLALLVVVCRCG